MSWSEYESDDLVAVSVVPNPTYMLGSAVVVRRVPGAVGTVPNTDVVTFWVMASPRPSLNVTR